MDRKDYLRGVDRVIIKVGTRVLTREDNTIILERIDRLASQVVKLRERGISCTIVTSGAVGAGLGRLGLGSYPRLVPQRQAVAAVGQVRLMKMWEHAFAEYDTHVGQVLVSAEDIQNRRRFVNLQNTLECLIGMNVVPIINENDSVSVKEISYGDNDSLSAQVAGVINAGLLIIMTDIDGLYTANPKKDPSAERVPFVSEITGAITRSTKGKGSGVSIGGMRSKIDAARLATAAGRACVVASGIECRIEDIVNGEDVGTFFVPVAENMARRKQWIAFSSRTKGRIYVDEGASDALLNRGKSLLASGVRELKGRFQSGDVVEISTAENAPAFARGVSSFSSADLDKIKGLHSSKIEDVLGHSAPLEVIHKDKLALVDKKANQ